MMGSLLLKMTLDISAVQCCESLASHTINLTATFFPPLTVFSSRISTLVSIKRTGGNKRNRVGRIFYLLHEKEYRLGQKIFLLHEK